MKRLLAAFAGLLLAAGCSQNTQSVPSGMLPAAPAPRAAAALSPIHHIVIVVQENRTFDDFFATFPGARGTTTGRSKSHGIVTLKAVNLQNYDLGHDHQDFVNEYDRGKMDGWDTIDLGSQGQYGPAGIFAYQYVKPAQIVPYWTLAKQYVLADNAFPTQSSGSFTAHLDLIAGNTEFAPGHSAIDFPTDENAPWGCGDGQGSATSLITPKRYVPGGGPFPCFTFKTLGDTLDAAHVSWKYYVPTTPDPAGYEYNAFQAIADVRCGTFVSTPTTKTCNGLGADWANISSPPTNVFSDLKNGTLPAVSWVIPDYVNSDHPTDPTFRSGKPVFGPDYGPQWVASIVNAVGESKYWRHTLVVVLWDDWGGFYDHVTPPQTDYQGMSFRVPMIFISPYVAKGVVDHTLFNFGSIVRCVENVYRLSPDLIPADYTQPNSICSGPTSVLNLKQPPRRFAPIPTSKDARFFLRQKPSGLPVDTE